MEGIILITPDQMRALIAEAIAPLQAQLDIMLSGKTRSRMLSSIEAGKLVGKGNATICRWCRGILVDGHQVVLKHQRLPSGKYLIDEKDLLTFADQVTQHYQAEEPVTTQPATETNWSFTRQRRRKEND